MSPVGATSPATHVVSRRRREIVLSIHLKAYDADEDRYFRPGPQGKVHDFPINELISETSEIVEKMLPNDLRYIFGINAETRVIAVREGSVVIFFGAIITGLVTLSKYKSLYESVQLLKKHCERLVEGLIARKYGKTGIGVDVNVEYPHLRDPDDRPISRRIRRLLHGPVEEELLDAMLSGDNGLPVASRRDSFFWFLMCLCIAEGGALVLLVWQAVVKTYFP